MKTFRAVGVVITTLIGIFLLIVSFLNGHAARYAEATYFLVLGLWNLRIADQFMKVEVKQ